MQIESFFDKATSTISYIVIDPTTKSCAIIDSVRDFDLPSGKISNKSAEKLISFIRKNKLKLEWILETHVHADHLTAASYIKERLGGKLGIGKHITEVLKHWVPIFNSEDDTPIDGSQYDKLFEDGETFAIGNLKVNVIHTPGHTPDCISYHINNDIIVGDTILMPYIGTARTDFPGGSAAILYESIKKILSLPDQTRIHTCHDYPQRGKNPAWTSTVAEQKKMNEMVNTTIKKEDYIKERNKRDESKPVPTLLLPAIQVNMRAGDLGQIESNDTQYIKVPINRL